MRYRFGDFELDDATFELLRAGELVPLRPQALDVVLHLVRARDRVVPREELLEAIWPDTAVSATALAQAIVAARRALGDDTDEPQIIQTVRARGYRFIAPVVEDGQREGAAPPPARADADLVGREPQVAALEGLLREAREGRGGVALVTGEPGIGKTRLAAEIADRAAAAGVLVVGARCHDDAAAPELWPWIQVMRELGRDPVAGPELARHAAVAALVRETPSAANDPQARFRLSDEAARMLREVSRARPLLVVLDDVQWADEESLALIKFVARELATSRALLLVAYRSTSGDGALARTMGALARADPGRAFALRGLTREEIARLAAKTHGRELSEPAVSRIHEKTEGNPLFVTQLLHAMRPGTSESARGGATSAVLSREVMRDAIAMHLDELSPACVRVLGMAAVLGRSFSLATLSGTAGIDTAQLLPLLDEAIRARIVARPSSGGAEHRFVHALVRDVLYRRLSVAERVRLHAAAGEAILARTPAPEGDALDAVAVHFAEAAAGGEVARAIAWCARAARSAETPEEALEHLERGAASLAFAPSIAQTAIDALDGELTSLAARAPALAERVESTRRSIRAGR